MKKTLLVTIGVVLILLGLGVWGYLLIFGTPENTQDVFSNFGLGDNPPVVNTQPVETEEEREDTQLAINGQALQQLTTRPVAGFGYVEGDSDILRYVERGTGYVYEIDTTDGSEERITGTTIPRVVAAYFSEDGESVAMIVEESTNTRVLAGIIDTDEESIDFITLPPGAFDPVFKDTTTIQYGVHTNDGTDIFELTITSNNPTRTHTVPFKDVTILADDTAYVFNRPTEYFKGSLYRVGNTLSPVTPGDFGFVGGVNAAYYLGSGIQDGNYTSYAIDRTSDNVLRLPVMYVPEKCAFVSSNDSLIWCAMSFDGFGDSFLEAWYQGSVSSEDVLWRVDIGAQEATLHSVFLEDSGRRIDVDMMHSDTAGEKPLFRNRLNNTLWRYDSTL